MATPKEPVVLNRLDVLARPSKKSTILFLHGLGDDGRGTGYGLAQQFQLFQKLPSTRWVLPTAPVDPAVGQRCWYKPHNLPSSAEPQASSHKDEGSAPPADEGEDEEGLLRTVEYIDSLIAKEVEEGTDPAKIVVGGFSQGCAVSMVWGLRGQWRDKVAGVFGLSGYFPRIKAVAPDVLGGEDGGGKFAPSWFFGHGMADQLVPISVFADGQKRLQQYIAREKIEGHVYEELAHDVRGGEIRDFWLWLKAVLEEDDAA